MLTTHFLDEAEQLADTVVVIDAGRVVAAGHARRADPRRRRGPDPVPGRRRTCALELLLRRCRPERRCAEEGEPGATWSPATSTPQLLATLTAWCAGQDVLAEDLAVERRSLEDVFLDLTGRELRA